jgi:prepilin-type N-terminal cleavage/methylation domain-containing protein
MSSHKGFTLIELLVVIAIIAILAVVVVLTINPAQLMAESRDANRVSDMATLQSALNLLITDGAAGGTAPYLGSPNTVYVSLPDPTISGAATSTCASLGLPALPTGDTYQCSSPQDYRNANGTGWIPVNFNATSLGSTPLDSLPVDPTNASSSGLYYTYVTNGSQYEVTALPESAKQKASLAQSPEIPDYPDVIAAGTNLALSPLWSSQGLVGWWPLDEGTGSTAYDQSGNENNGTWSGTMASPNSTYYGTGKVYPYAGWFDGTNNDVNLGNPTILQITNAITIALWVNPSSLPTYSAFISNFQGGSYNNGAFAMRMISGNLITNFFFSSGSSLQIAQSFNTKNTWSYFVATYDGSHGVVYLNGKSFATGNATGSITYSQGYNWLIDGTYPGGSGIPGSINDVRIYNRALSPAEVMALYNAEK